MRTDDEGENWKSAQCKVFHDYIEMNNLMVFPVLKFELMKASNRPRRTPVLRKFLS